ncbi:MAG TPA: hypothetical protein VMF06_21855, partial [Candidatus Limnocylindria bacterium]|nr:hypothetical protein [Candidatus Limnocylindria bacterium]
NIGRMQFSRQWALILMMFSEEHGRLPGPDDDLSHYDLPDQEIHGVKMTSTDLELTSATPIKEIANPAAAFIGRERNLWLTPDEGKLGRTYVFADGHTEIRTYASTDDIDRWEKQHLPQLRESQ